MSQVSTYRIENVEDLKEMFAPGDEVFVKVLSIDESTGKYSLSIKYVNQRDGMDLDPLGEKAKKDIERRNRPPGADGKREDNDRRIKLEYKYDVVCQKCGGLGHLASECFSAIAPKGESADGVAPDPGRGYKMVPDNPDEDKWYQAIERRQQKEAEKAVRPYPVWVTSRSYSNLSAILDPYS
jgi:hypothetical protein